MLRVLPVMNSLKSLILRLLSSLEFRTLSTKLNSKKSKIFIIIFFGIFLTFSSNQSRSENLSLDYHLPLLKTLPISPQPLPLPQPIASESAPNLSAEGAILLEPGSFKIIYAKNPNQRFYPASLTKLLTALTALEYYSPEDSLTVPKMNVEGQVMGLVEGEKMKVKDLLYGLLVKSGNDAALTLAASEKVNIDQFIYSLNEVAIRLNMKNTHFNNPTGLDDENHYTTPHDAVILGAAVVKHPILSEIVKTKRITVSDVEKKNWHELDNVNLLLGENGVEGIKTGWTEKAGQALLSFSHREGRSLISVVLKSEDRFGETRSLLDWGYRTYRW